MTPEAKAAHVCILKPDGSPAGGGVLVSATRIATCAHVVDLACGRPMGSKMPPGNGEKIEFVFPHLHGEPCGLGHVCEEAWEPYLSALETTGDFALIALDDERTGCASFDTLAWDRVERGGDLDVRIWGHHASGRQGAEITLRYVSNKPGEVLQLRGDGNAGYFVKPGASGCGVFTDTGLVGIVAAYDPTPNLKEAVAISLQKIDAAIGPVQNEKTRWQHHALCAEEKDTHTRLYSALLSRELSKLSDPVLQTLRDELSLELGGKPTPGTPREIAGLLLDQTQLPTACDVIRAVHRENGDDLTEPDRERLTNAVLLAAAGSLTGEDLQYVAWMRESRSEQVSLDAVAGSATKADILAAAVDRLVPKLLNRENEGDFPPGQHRIAPPPEVGPDPDNNAYAAAVEFFLDKALNPAKLVEKIEAQLSPRIFGTAGAVQNRGRTALVKALEARRNDKRRSYYITPPSPGDDPAQQAQLQALCEKIVQDLKHVLVIALSQDRADDELVEFGAVRHTVIDNTRRSKNAD